MRLLDASSTAKPLTSMAALQTAINPKKQQGQTRAKVDEIGTYGKVREKEKASYHKLA